MLCVWFSLYSNLEPHTWIQTSQETVTHRSISVCGVTVLCLKFSHEYATLSVFILYALHDLMKIVHKEQSIRSDTGQSSGSLNGALVGKFPSFSLMMSFKAWWTSNRHEVLFDNLLSLGKEIFIVSIFGLHILLGSLLSISSQTFSTFSSVPTDGGRPLPSLYQELTSNKEIVVHFAFPSFLDFERQFLTQCIIFNQIFTDT